MEYIMSQKLLEIEDRKQSYLLISTLLSSSVDEVFLQELSKSDTEFNCALDDFIASLNAENIHQSSIDVIADYSALFLNMSKHPVSTYESVWVSPNNMLMQEPRNEVVEAYLKAGFSQDKEVHLPEDHIATELEFMGILCEKEIAAISHGDAENSEYYATMQKDFYSQHLHKWVYSFCDDVKLKAKTDFYVGTAQLLEGFMQLEEDLFLD